MSGGKDTLLRDSILHLHLHLHLQESENSPWVVHPPEGYPPQGQVSLHPSAGYTNSFRSNFGIMSL